MSAAEGADEAGWRSAARPIVARLAFPIVLGAALFFTAQAIEAGVAPAVALGPATIGSLVAIFALERFFPYQRDWLRSHGDIRVDATYALMVTGLIELIRPAIYTVALLGAAAITARWQGGLWPTEWPIALQLVIALVVAELPKYWFHRLQHEHDWLWRFHAPHHSVPRLYWLNASRFHPVDIAVDTLLGVGTLVALGCGETVMALFLLTASVHGAFQHANLEIRLGFLNWIFSMAELHRWHHSRVTEEANHNYGQNLIVWDIVFGTRFLPDDREPPTDIGLADLPNYPTGFLAQLASPFRWSRIRAEAAGER